MYNMEFSKEEKDRLINLIKEFFWKEREEEIGDLAAMLILDFMTKEIGPFFYNRGIKDAYKYMLDKLEDLSSLEIYP